MNYLEVFGVLIGVGVDVSKFSESQQESQSVEQERSRSLKNVTPLISASNMYLGTVWRRAWL